MSDTADFLLELLSEEIPARMQARARNDLARLFAEQLASAGLSHDGIVTYSTPRRLALIARGLPLATEAVSEELKGPRTSAPPQALEGFLRKTGLTQDQLEERDGVYFATIDKAGRATSEMLAEAVANIVRDFQWPKSMRWGDASVSTASMRWVRPLHSIVALLGEEIVPVAIEGVACGAATLGHRFHHPGPITLGGAHDYVEKLRACHVIVDQEEREATIRQGAAEAAAKAGFALVEDEGLVVENAGLTEWPVPLLGSFDPDFLDVPGEVIALTARTNQKYFVMRDAAGKLAPHFVCTANISANDGGAAIVAGNERVLAARLSDARFFWEQDLKVPLDEQAKKLEQIVFHEKLGFVDGKVRRILDLALWLIDQDIVTAELQTPQGKTELYNQVRRAASLAKADLVSGMVGEFPELQGIVGGYIAAAQGEPKAIADAIGDHYKPIGQGDQIPTMPVSVAVALADKLDTLSAFFAIGVRPTGSKDPFALRRTGIAILAILIGHGMRVSTIGLLRAAVMRLGSVINGQLYIDGIVDPEAKVEQALGDEALAKEFERRFPDVLDPEWYPPANPRSEFPAISFADPDEVVSALLAFLIDRLKVQQREAGVRHDLIDAMFALGGEDDLVRLLARVTALQAFVETGEGTNLLAGYKRAANILKKEDWTGRKGVMAVPGSQGISQTGEEDPLSLVEEPAIAEAVAEMAEGHRSREHILPEEAALREAVRRAEPEAAAAIEREDFTAAMSALASLRAPIDAFFDKVTVNDPDADIRARRLNLLLRFRDAVNRVADFSKIEG